MFAVIGLGNPGSRYASSRHNLGFWVLDEIARRLATESPVSWKERSGCRYAQVNVNQIQLLLVQPQLYMNLSGQAVKPLLDYFKIEREKLVIVHDDLDLDPGVLRLKFAGGSGGHQGLNDLVRNLGDGDFFRVRIGIGHPNNIKEFSAADNLPGNFSQNIKQTKVSALDQSVSSWVLGRPGPKDKELLEKAVLAAADAVIVLINDGLEAAQRKFHSLG